MTDDSLPGGDIELQPGEAARMLGISVPGLITWERNGWIQCERTRGGHRRFKLSEVQRADAAHRRGDFGNHRSQVRRALALMEAKYPQWHVFIDKHGRFWAVYLDPESPEVLCSVTPEGLTEQIHYYYKKGQLPVGVRIDDYVFTSDETKHSAHALTTISWHVTWLADDIRITRNQAITAMLLAEFIESRDDLAEYNYPHYAEMSPPFMDGSQVVALLGRETWTRINIWAGELGVDGVAAINSVLGRRRWEPR